MNVELAQVMFCARRGKCPQEATWRKIVDELLADLRQFVREDFESDSVPWVDLSAPSFNTWIWSQPRSEFPIGISWSGVVAGSLVDVDEFMVFANLFLFDSLTKSRLATARGESFFQLAYKRDSADSGHWTSIGWCRDEWGEWADVQFSDEEAPHPASPANVEKELGRN